MMEFKKDVEAFLVQATRNTSAEYGNFVYNLSQEIRATNRQFLTESPMVMTGSTLSQSGDVLGTMKKRQQVYKNFNKFALKTIHSLSLPENTELVHQPTTDGISHVLLDHNKKEASFISNAVRRNDGLSQTLIINKTGLKGFGKNFVLNHLLPKYKTVYSDEFQTEAGKKLWKSIVQTHPLDKIKLVSSTGEESLLDPSKESDIWSHNIINSIKITH